MVFSSCWYQFSLQKSAMWFFFFASGHPTHSNYPFLWNKAFCSDSFSSTKLLIQSDCQATDLMLKNGWRTRSTTVPSRPSLSTPWPSPGTLSRTLHSRLPEITSGTLSSTSTKIPPWPKSLFSTREQASWTSRYGCLDFDIFGFFFVFRKTRYAYFNRVLRIQIFLFGVSFPPQKNLILAIRTRICTEHRLE